MIRRPPRSTLFPYTTLFRSNDVPYGRLTSARGSKGSWVLFEGNDLVQAAQTPRNFSQNWQEAVRSEEHTSELQSHVNLVCRLLLEKKKKKKKEQTTEKKNKD